MTKKELKALHPEPEARAYAAEHSIPWPGEWGEEGDGWEYGIHQSQTTSFPVYRRRGKELETVQRNRKRWEHSINSLLWFGEPDKIKPCTRADAKKAIEAAGGTWPGESLSNREPADAAFTGRETFHHEP